MITVENSRTADATANFRCYVDGEDADTAPSTITASLAAGEVKDIPVTWYVYADGSQTLTCTSFLPVALNEVANEVANLDGAASDPVVWTYAEETEDAPLIIWAVAIAGFMALALWIASQRRQQEKEYSSHPIESQREAEQKVHPEENKSAEAEEDEPSQAEVEETEEESTESVYDLQPEDED